MDLRVEAELSPFLARWPCLQVVPRKINADYSPSGLLKDVIRKLDVSSQLNAGAESLKGWSEGDLIVTSVIH